MKHLVVTFSILLFCCQTVRSQDAGFNWAKQLTGSGSPNIEEIGTDASGNVYVLGYFTGEVDFDPSASQNLMTSAGGDDIFLAKYTAAGDLVWVRQMGTGTAERATGLKLDGSNNAYICGYFEGTIDLNPGGTVANLTSNGGTDGLVAKYNSAGILQWSQKIGGSSHDQAIEIDYDVNGGVYVTGYFQGTIDLDPGTGTNSKTSAGMQDVYIIKYNASGVYQWGQVVVSGSLFDVPGDIAVDCCGGYLYLTGEFYSTADFNPSATTTNLVSAGGFDAFVAKYTATGGAYQWAFRMGSAADDMGRHIEFYDAGSNTGSVYVAGTYMASMDLDPGAGTATATYAGGSFEDIFLAKYDASGTFSWGNGMGSTNMDIPTNLSLIGSANLLMSGYFRGTVDFDPGAGTYNLTSSPAVNSNAFLLYYSDLGAVHWGKNIPSALWSKASALGWSSGSQLSLYLGGTYYGQTDFDTGAGVYNMTTDTGPDEAFFARYTDMNTEPAQATSLGFSGATTTNLTLNYTGSGATGYLILRKAGSSMTAVPVDGTNYVAGNTLGDATIAYVGASTSFTNVSLTPGTQYYYKVFAYNGASVSTNYNTNGLSGSAYTLLPAPVATAATAIMKTAFTANWNAVAGATEYRLDVSTDNFSTNLPGYSNLLVSTTSSVVSGLIAGVTYQYRVRAVNPGSTSVNSASITAITLAAPVIQLPASITQTSFVANWQAVASAVDYRLDVSANDFSSNIVGYDNLTVTGTSASVSGLNPGSIYKYRVRASSGSDISDNSNPISVLMVPATPSALAATVVQATYFTANWSASTGAVWYRVDVSADGFATMLTGYDNLAVVGTSVTVSGVSSGTPYSYRIRAENSSGVSSNSSSIPVLTLPAAPTPLPATNVSVSSFTANWGPSTGATSYRLDVSADNFLTFLPGFNDLIVSGTSQLVSSLPGAATWKYRVRAVNSTGVSVNSDEVTVITAQASQIVFSNVGPTQITVNYTNGAGTSRLLVVKQASEVDAFPVDGTTYTVFDGSYGTGSELGSGNFVVRKGSGPAIVSGLSPATTYHFRVFEFAGGPNEVYSLATATGNPASRSTLAIEPTAQSPGLEFNNETVSSLLVSILPAAGSPESYLAVRYVNAVPTGAPVDGTGYTNESMGNGQIVYVGPAGNFFNPGLTSNTEYTYAVFSFNGSGATSNYLTFSPRIATGLTLPDAPVASNASNTGQDLFDANWNAPSGTGALTYEIEVATVNTFSFLLKSLTASTTSVRVDGLTPDTDYYYRIRAVNSAGVSVNSNVITIRTLSTPVVDPLKVNTAPATQVATPALMTQTVNVTGGTGTVSVVMRHRFISGTTFGSTPMAVAGSGNYTVTITSDMMDELGVEFYFEATDQASVTATSVGHSFLYRSIASATTSIPFASSFNGTQETYEMFSVPYLLNDKSVASVFSSQGPPDKTKWRMLRYQGGRYLEYPENIVNVDLGKGYWFNTTAKTDIAVGSGSVFQASETSPFTIPVEKGWNQIGNPFPFSIDWSTVRNLPANASLGLNSLWTYANGAYSNTTGFKPWMGGFVFSDNGGTLTIPVTSRCSGCRMATEPILADLDAPSWQVPIALSLHGTGQVAAVGMHPEARMTKDRFDEIVVPRFNYYVEFYTRHPEFFAPQFAVDMVPQAAEASWMFTVSSNYPDGLAVLRWDPLPLQQSSAALALVDMTEGMLVDMKAVGEYAFSFADKKQFKVVYSRDGEVKPGLTMLGQSYPNPFQAGVSIPIMLEAPQSRLQIQVFDLRGHRVRTLTREAVQAGALVVTWDGRTEDGREVDSGLYLYRLVGDSGLPVSVKRMIKQ